MDLITHRDDAYLPFSKAKCDRYWITTHEVTVRADREASAFAAGEI
ncbi:MAG: hypothetical protein ACYDAD_01340 [Acidimicrobiales bacterium]